MISDSVDRLLQGWARTRPDLDVSPVGIIARLNRLRRFIDAEVESTFAEHGLNGPDFAVLATLRRLDPPDGISQRELMRELRLSSGTVSVRVERLAEQGLVTRTPDPVDRRNTLVALTAHGLALFDRVAPAHVRTENRLLAALNAEQREQLAGLLRELLVSFEGSGPDGEVPPLGLVLAPAHVTLEMRRALGLPEVMGLLVRQVAPDGRAARAGVRTGDVLVRAGRCDLCSVTCLDTALRQGGSRLVVSAVRGVDTGLKFTLDLRGDPGDPQPSGPLAAHEAGVHAL